VTDWLIGRENLAGRREEAFRPPPHRLATGSPVDRARHAARILLDLQFGSIWRDLARILPSVRGSLVDVGCGAQPFRPLLSGEVAYIGVDTVDAERRFGYRTPDTRYYSGDRLPVDDASADCVLCTETLEHVLEPLPFLCELRRCLKPGGRLVLTVPFAARWHFVPFDYWRYTPSGLRHLLGQSGYADVAVYARGGPVAVACYKVMGCILPLLLSSAPSLPLRWARRLLGVALSPLLAVAAAIANLALLSRSGGEDCLGYTVTACRPTAAEASA
jgi:SAM-dependent methyltransferase